MSYRSFLTPSPFVTAGAVLVGMVIGYGVAYFYPVLPECQYEFINPQFACGSQVEEMAGERAELRNHIESYVKEVKASGNAVEVAVYFRELLDGPMFGINDRIQFIPASLLKLPKVLAVYALAEQDPRLYEATLMATRTPDSLVQHFMPTDHITVGTSYTVAEVAEFSLEYSDNTADWMINQLLIQSDGGTEILEDTFTTLGIINPGGDIALASMSAKQYGSIFRQLYNASFLNEAQSEAVLTAMVRSPFDKGLRRGIPGDIAVAHKFGERFLESGERHLHDCGIVYYPGRPYVLCIMTRGTNFDTLSRIIGHISQEVFTEIQSGNR